MTESSQGSEVSTPSEFDALSREELIELVQAQGEGPIRIQFAGKTVARRLARRVRPRVMEQIKKYSVGTPEEQAASQVIEGDNLQAMSTLYRYRGHVDLILTDPPYNTGNDFRYNDRWDVDPNDDGIGDLVPDTDGARHTKWMKFMWPRLQMMRSMLKETGVLAICIDQRELFHLGQMLDEMFGQANRLAIINWQKASAPKNDKTHVSSTTEYVLVYAKNTKKAATAALPRSEASFDRYKNPDDDPRGLWREHDLTARTPSARDQYGIQSPFDGTIHYPAGHTSWRYPKRRIKLWLEEWGVEYVARNIGDGRPPALLVKGGKPLPLETTEERPRTRPGSVPKAAAKAAAVVLKRGQWPFVWWGLTGSGGPRPKRYLEGIRKGFVPMTYWADEEYEEPLEIGSTSWDWEQSGLSQTGIKELSALIGKGHGFETVKPLQLMAKIIQIWCPPDGVVLDPFAGSGTTGHAVWQLNAETDAKRQFVLIEQGRPERGDSFARTLVAERLRRAQSGDWAAGPKPPLPGGFRFMELRKRVDAEALLRMERDEMAETMMFSYFDSSRRGRGGLVRVDDEYRFLVARNEDDEGFFLVWDGPSGNTSLTRNVYIEIVNEAKKAGLKKRFHVYARQQLYVTDNVSFYQIPDRILSDFGLNPMSEPFNEAEE